VAGAGRKVWTNETLSVAGLQNYLQDQAVMVFANAAARSAAITAPTEGMVSYLSDVDTLAVYTASVSTGALGWQTMPWGDTGWQPLTINGPAGERHRRGGLPPSGADRIRPHPRRLFGCVDVRVHDHDAAHVVPAVSETVVRRAVLRQ
jgi:hypothetical protein